MKRMTFYFRHGLQYDLLLYEDINIQQINEYLSKGGFMSFGTSPESPNGASICVADLVLIALSHIDDPDVTAGKLVQVDARP